MSSTDSDSDDEVIQQIFRNQERLEKTYKRRSNLLVLALVIVSVLSDIFSGFVLFQSAKNIKISESLRKNMKKVSFDSPELRKNTKGLLLQFINARVLRGSKLVDDHLWVRDGRIIDAASIFFDERRQADLQIDCQGLILSPGFIDIQINGGFGVDFSTVPKSDAEYVRGLSKVAKELLAHGVTSFAPTVITSAPEIYHRVLPLLRRRNGSHEGAGILGAHVEGPFISPSKRGCHPPQFINTFGVNAEKKLLEVYGSLENVAIVTLAPELEHSEDAIKVLAKNGVIVSLGHSASGLADGERAVRAGASCITHLFNAMQSYHHRDPGLIGLLTSQKINRPIHYGIISDGIHTDDSALRIAHRTNPEGLVLVTDAILALGMPDGQHKFGAQTINVTGMSAVLDGTNTAAGSVVSMPYSVRHFVKAARCSLEEALLAATEKPANVMNLADRGVLNTGTSADIVLLSDDVKVKATFIAGELVFVP